MLAAHLAQVALPVRSALAAHLAQVVLRVQPALAAHLAQVVQKLPPFGLRFLLRCDATLQIPPQLLFQIAVQGQQSVDVGWTVSPVRKLYFVLQLHVRFPSGQRLQCLFPVLFHWAVSIEWLKFAAQLLRFLPEQPAWQAVQGKLLARVLQ